MGLSLLQGREIEREIEELRIRVVVFFSAKIRQKA